MNPVKNSGAPPSLAQQEKLPPPSSPDRTDIFGSRRRFSASKANVELEHFLKTALDLVLATAGLVCLAPLFGVIVLAIKLDSKGPAFHRSRRAGIRGTIFDMLKFRTMFVQHDHPQFLSTADDDPRITRVGKFLRHHKLDELPQLINVLKREMSIVGPRPDFERYTRLYKGEDKLILSVLPGITDPASVRFRNLNRLLSNNGDPDAYYLEHVFVEKNRLRLAYVKNHSFLADIGIILQTIRSIWWD